MSYNLIQPLNSLVKIRGGKRLPAGKALQAEPNSHPYIRVRDIGQRELPKQGLEYVPDELFQPIARYIVETNNVVLSIVGTIGALSVVDQKYHLASLTENCVRLNGLDRQDALYLYYYLTSPNGQYEIAKGTVGAVQPKLPIYNIEKIPVPWPDKLIRQSISNILCALDDRIALLRETNTTLEAIAQALFKSWFVDFDPVHINADLLPSPSGRGAGGEGNDSSSPHPNPLPVGEGVVLPPEIAALFPDSFEESELGLVPSGWRVGTLEDCCERVESGGTPKRSKANYWNGDIAWITSGEVRNPIVFESKEKITTLGVKESSAKIWPTGTTIIAMYGATAGEVCLLANPATANQACCGLIPSKNARSFLFFCTRRERENLASKSSGSAQQNLNKGLVCSHKIVLPATNLVAVYEQVVGELLNGWIDNEQQAQTLTTLRDTLLPRLISGQLRLPEAVGRVSLQGVTRQIEAKMSGNA